MTDTNIASLINLFTREDYPVNETGFSQVPFDDIWNALIGLFPEGFDYKVVGSGVTCDNKNYVFVDLILPLGDRLVTRAGGADGTIGMPGLICMALRNAALRHFGMGQALYEREEGEPTESFNYGDNRPATTYGNPNTQNTPSNTNGQRPFGAWDGNVKIKSGPFIGQTWSSIPDDSIQEWAAKGSPIAVKELQRRQGGSSQYPRSPFRR